MFSEFIGCIFYADDIILLSASVRQLQMMLDICTQFANENCLTFNTQKSYCMIFGNAVDLNKLLSVSIASKAIAWVDSCCYLGNKLISGKRFLIDVHDRKRKFFGAVNNVLSNGRGLSEECLIELIHKQCLPILTYGCCNWNLNSEGKRQISVCFNRAIRRIFGYIGTVSLSET